MTDFLLSLQQFSTPLLDNVFLAISALTGELSYIIILGIVYWCIDKDRAYYIGTFLFLSFSVNTFFKNLFHIPRPYTYSDVRQIDVNTGYGYSFPSGHAQLSTTFAGMFSAVFRKKWMYIAGIILVILTGFSRMYLGVHTPADILCGIGVGLLLTALGNLLKNSSNKKLLSFAAFLLMFGVTLVYNSEDILKLLFFAAGFLSGNIIEEKYIGYKIPEKVKPRIIGSAAGFAGLMLLTTILKILGLTYIRYLALGLYMTIVVPSIIKYLNIKSSLV
ncbi:MAG: phosphatase PAP2 family protein [Clostridia bacterium]|nr:phosphatase PAP2 family protein [Clostridia bacterium]